MTIRGDSPQSSALALCLQSLVEGGRAAVSAAPPRDNEDDALPLLQQFDASAREALALDLPGFLPRAALWGARLFHDLCRFVVCRDISQAQIDAACAVACPEPRGPETDWSVDLTLRHSPRLFQLARHLSNADPLLDQMKRIAACWPLSSVGIPGLVNLRSNSFIGHPGLRRLYADRVIAAGDCARLGDPQLDDSLRADFGMHRNLAPDLAAKLFSAP